MEGEKNLVNNCLCDKNYNRRGKVLTVCPFCMVGVQLEEQLAVCHCVCHWNCREWKG